MGREQARNTWNGDDPTLVTLLKDKASSIIKTVGVKAQEGVDTVMDSDPVKATIAKAKEYGVTASTYAKATTEDVADYIEENVVEPYKNSEADDIAETVGGYIGTWEEKYNQAKADFGDEFSKYDMGNLEKLNMRNVIRTGVSILDEYKGTLAEKYAKATEDGYAMPKFSDMFPEKKLPQDSMEIQDGVTPSAGPEEEYRSGDFIFTDKGKSNDPALLGLSSSALDPLENKMIGGIIEGVGTGVKRVNSIPAVKKVTEPILAKPGQWLDELQAWYRGTFASAKQKETLKTGTRAQQEQVVKDLHEAKNAGVTDNTYSTTTRSDGSTNIHAKNAEADQANRQVTNKIRKLIKSGDQSVEDIAETTSEIVTQAEKRMKNGVNQAYDKVGEYANDIPYEDTLKFQDGVIKKLVDAGEDPKVIAEIERDFEYAWRNLSPSQQIVQKRLGKSQSAEQHTLNSIKVKKQVIEDNEGRLSAILNERKLAQKAELDELGLKMTAEKSAQAKLPATERSANGVNKIQASIDKVKNRRLLKETDEVTLNQNKASLARAEDDLVEIQTGIKIDKANLPDMDKITAKQMMQQIKMINKKIGGIENLADKGAYKQVLKAMYKRFETMTKGNDRQAYEAFANAQATAKEYHQTFGRDALQSKLVNGGSGTLDEAGNIAQEVSTILRDPDKVESFIKMLQRESPDQAKVFVQEFINRKLGSITQGKMGFDQAGDLVDVPALATKLDELLGDTQFTRIIEAGAGKAKLQNLRSTHKLASGLADYQAKNPDVSFNGIRGYFADKKGMGNLSGALRWAYDGLRSGMHKLGSIGGDASLLKSGEAFAKGNVKDGLGNLIKTVTAPTMLKNKYLTGINENGTSGMDSIMKLFLNKLNPEKFSASKDLGKAFKSGTQSPIGKVGVEAQVGSNASANQEWTRALRPLIQDILNEYPEVTAPTEEDMKDIFGWVDNAVKVGTRLNPYANSARAVGEYGKGVKEDNEATKKQEYSSPVVRLISELFN